MSDTEKSFELKHSLDGTSLEHDSHRRIVAQVRREDRIGRVRMLVHDDAQRTQLVLRIGDGGERCDADGVEVLALRSTCQPALLSTCIEHNVDERHRLTGVDQCCHGGVFVGREWADWSARGQ